MRAREQDVAQKEHGWGSRVGVILAVAGSAVGLGNFLRFPGNAAQNGGGAFMIPYFTALVLLGIPIGWAEWVMGRYGGRKGFHSAPMILGVIGKGPVVRYLGVVGVLIPLVVYFYYMLIESWCLQYAFRYFTGGLDLGGAAIGDQVAVSTSTFAVVTAQQADGAVFRADHAGVLVAFLVTFALNLYFVHRGLSKGVELVCRYAMPVMAVCALIVLVRVMTLGTPDPAHPDQNVLAGLGFMWNPNFSKLGDAKTWMAAAGQVFFTLSVGFGVIINYASYLKQKDDVVLSGLTASATNEFFEVALGGMITIPAAVIFLGVELAQKTTGGTFSTGFIALPVVFAHMPFGRLFGGLWFFMLFLAAITSSLSMLQPVRAFLMETLDMDGRPATAVLGAVTFVGCGFVMFFSKDLAALDTLDFWVGTFVIFILAALQLFAFGWVFGIERGFKESEPGALLRIPGIFKFIMKYVAPTYLLVVFVMFCVQNVPGYVRSLSQNPVAVYSWVLILAAITAIVVVTRAGAQRLRARGMDIDGREEA
jgi:NSS family neurotransmitter:Na+ symporter